MDDDQRKTIVIDAVWGRIIGAIGGVALAGFVAMGAWLVTSLYSVKQDVAVLSRDFDNEKTRRAHEERQIDEQLREIKVDVKAIATSVADIRLSMQRLLTVAGPVSGPVQGQVQEVNIINDRWESASRILDRMSAQYIRTKGGGNAGLQ